MENIDKFKEKGSDILNTAIFILMEPEIEKLNKEYEILEKEKDKFELEKRKFEEKNRKFTEHKLTQIGFGIGINLLSSLAIIVISAAVWFLFTVGDMPGWIMDKLKNTNKTEITNMINKNSH